ncbi:MAG TPA: hypothetical protein VGS19_38665 [Streptosporangiaceae bacterium]|nr:hypothetical protein [Streptosporangiaceae bacterium]
MPSARVGLRAEQVALRERMRALGLGYEQIAQEFARRYRLRPRAAWRLAYGWSLSQAADQINATAAALGLDRHGRAAMTGAHLSEYEQWPGPGERLSGRKPTPHLLALLAATYNSPGIHDLLDMADYEHLPAADLLVLERRRAPRPAGSTADRGCEGMPRDAVAVVTAAQNIAATSRLRDPVVLAAMPPFGMPGAMEESVDGSAELAGWPGTDPVSAAAHESSEQAGEVASRSLAEATLDQLHDDITRITRAYTVVSPVAVFTEARRLRDVGYGLLTRTRRPAQEADLYFTAGVACGLLAAASFDLGRWGAATEQARAAGIFGTQVGHPGLRSWAKGMQALVAYWSGDPGAALTLAAEAQRAAPGGTAMVRLRCIEARAWAHQGREHEAEQAIAGADRAREQGDGPEELHDGIGGQFGFDPGRQARCHASAYLQLGKSAKAVMWAETAISLYRAMPEGRRWVKIQAQAQADLAAARLMGGDLDGAGDALRPVLLTPVDFRVEGLTRRVRRVADMLTTPSYRGSAPARQLSGEISEFTAGALRPAIGP